MFKYELFNRDTYISQLSKLKDNGKVKVITGARHVGKTILINQYISYLSRHKVSKDNIIHIDLDDIRFINIKDHNSLYNYLSNTINHEERTYLFIDEINKVSNFENAINQSLKDFNIDLVLSVSNNYIFAKKINASIDIVNLYPFSFKEYIKYTKELLISDDESNVDLNIIELFQKYIVSGGIPNPYSKVSNNSLSDLESVYALIAIKDIIKTNSSLDFNNLDLIFTYLCSHVSEPLSYHNIAVEASNYLKDLKRDNKLNIAVKTVNKYIEIMENAYLIYPVKRIDLRTGKELKTIGKNYVFDTGLRNSIVGYKNSDKLFLIENIVYLELLRRGYEVFIGKVYDYEINFIAELNNEKFYIQVTESIIAEDSREKALKPFTFLKEKQQNKVVITMDYNVITSFDGIKLYNIIDWLISDSM